MYNNLKDSKKNPRTMVTIVSFGVVCSVVITSCYGVLGSSVFQGSTSEVILMQLPSEYIIVMINRMLYGIFYLPVSIVDACREAGDYRCGVPKARTRFQPNGHITCTAVPVSPF
eukprot:GHVH01014471.1.p1 GENE.GHVH01014471.1~~GHVH01014471.1.p1  ORF type:complete len:114 (+),score=4.24 GHVH01014471.1:742-1083(+)